MRLGATITLLDRHPAKRLRVSFASSTIGHFYTKRKTFIIIVIFMAIILVKELGFWVKIVQIPGSYIWLNIKTMNKNEIYLFFISQDGTQQRHTRPTTTKTFEISISFYCDICINI